MEKEKIRFWTAVLVGFVVMLLFAILTVNVMDLVPVVGPFFGGIVAGYLAGKDLLNGAKAGFAAGVLGLAAVSIDFMANTGYLRAAIPSVLQVAGVLFLVWAMIVYFPILAFTGGALGGAVRRHGTG